ncbi:uncharacterized protein VTP21DRAFT_4544 [Calcarisporiella thermophila]|uniref:uncharacterized protein n=1 Tax=Calcarisporiella thermophila TaxID=911321 RepID=UPI003742DB71
MDPLPIRSLSAGLGPSPLTHFLLSLSIPCSPRLFAHGLFKLKLVSEKKWGLRNRHKSTRIATSHEMPNMAESANRAEAGWAQIPRPVTASPAKRSSFPVLCLVY